VSQKGKPWKKKMHPMGQPGRKKSGIAGNKTRPTAFGHMQTNRFTLKFSTVFSHRHSATLCCRLSRSEELDRFVTHYSRAENYMRFVGTETDGLIAVRTA
jgi:hypothetical protein